MQSVHKAVLLHEVVEQLTRGLSHDHDPIYLDGTLGGGGHALAIARALSSKVQIIGLDLDMQAILRNRESLAKEAQKVILENESFRNLDKVLDRNDINKVDIVLFDLGLSSDELQDSGKGFSFQKDEPLVMTIGDPSKYPFTAKDVVNNWKEEDIANVIYAYGEERWARRIAKKIVQYREKKEIESSGELAEIVRGAIHRSFFSKIDPATKTFQALRIVVNDEINALKEGLEKGYARLNKDGRIAVISFHSLEDRVVKEFFKQKQKENNAEVSKKPICAGENEIIENRRARSAKLRILIKKQ